MPTTKTKPRLTPRTNTIPSTNRVAGARVTATRVVPVPKPKAKIVPVPPPPISKNKPPRVQVVVSEQEALAELLLTPPQNMDDYLLRIRMLGERISTYVRFMGEVEKMTGTCAEFKSRSVMRFYDRLILMERELNRIQEELQLG